MIPFFTERFQSKIAFLCAMTVVLAVGEPTPALAQPAADSCSFRYLAPEVGERVWQHVTMLAHLTTTHEQSGQKIAQEVRTVSREQVRRIEVLEANAGTNAARLPYSTKVRVEYEKAQETALHRGHEPQIQAQPVAGNSYIVWRQDGGLQVRSDDGSTPSKEEVEIVRQNLQSVGRRNPIAQFLRGRTVSVGDDLALPVELARELLGWKPEYGALKKEEVRLKLSGIREVAGTRCAVFGAELTGVPVLGSPRGTTMYGDLHIEIDTCRTIAVDMKARLFTREQRGPTGNTFFVSHRGQASLHTQSRFLKTRR